MVPPLMEIGPLVARSWQREMLPDVIWIAAMLGRRTDWRAAHTAMDVIDRFLPEGDR